MAEKIIAKLRVEKTEFADPITDFDGIASASWAAQPLTYREDAVEIVEGEPEEDELYSHENDAPEDSDVVGAGITAKGTFIKATRTQMVALMGGKTSGADETLQYQHAAKKVMLNKAIRFTCADGTKVVIPNAKGYVNLSLSIGKGGVAKFPFSFKCLTASPTWDCDIVM